MHAKGEKIPIRDVRIDYSEPWVRLHERAMTAAYNHSAFFEYYRDDLFRILEGQETFLFDLNWKLTEELIGMCGLRTTPTPTADFLPPVPVPDSGPLPSAPVTDLRTLIQPKYRGEGLLPRYGRAVPYFQLFPAGSSFIPDLSILDLLCAEGPNAISFLFTNGLFPFGEGADPVKGVFEGFGGADVRGDGIVTEDLAGPGHIT